MLKGPSLKFSGLHLSVIFCHFWTYDDNIGVLYRYASRQKKIHMYTTIGPNLKMPSFDMWGA